LPKLVNWVSPAALEDDRPTVSDLYQEIDKLLILNKLLKIFRDLFLITYDPPTITKLTAKLKPPKAEVLSGLS